LRPQILVYYNRVEEQQRHSSQHNEGGGPVSRAVAINVISAAVVNELDILPKRGVSEYISYTTTATYKAIQLDSAQANTLLGVSLNGILYPPTPLETRTPEVARAKLCSTSFPIFEHPVTLYSPHYRIVDHGMVLLATKQYINPNNQYE